MKRTCWTLISTAMLLAPLGAFGQRLNSYISDMGEALVPYGRITAPTCHRVEVDLVGPWSNYALPDGWAKGSPTPTWSVLKVDALRLYFDLAELDEDKVTNQALFSLEYIGKHQAGTKYIADTPAVMLFSKGLNSKITMHVVDLDKVHALSGQKGTTEQQMGMQLDERKFAILTFSDQQHADAFARAMGKAIILCKGQ